jgi:hypothetical protein
MATGTENAIVFSNESIDHIETDIMSRVCVFCARVAKTNEEKLHSW